jgi:Icc protein
MSKSDAPVVVIVPGDLHLTAQSFPNHRTALWVIREANDLVRPDVVQFIGDNVQDSTPEQYALFGELTRQLKVPWHALVGDHDAQGDAGASAFKARVGQPTGSLSLRGFRFVRLNSQEARPVGFSQPQIAWFRDEVDTATAAGERVVVLQHNYPYQIWEDFRGPGIDEWRAIVQTRRIHAILTGHTHYWQVANDGRNVAIALRSIGDPEGGPPGYALAFFHRHDFAVLYRTEEDRGPLVLVTHPRDVLLCTGARARRLRARRSPGESMGDADLDRGQSISR